MKNEHVILFKMKSNKYISKIQLMIYNYQSITYVFSSISSILYNH